MWESESRKGRMHESAQDEKGEPGADGSLVMTSHWVAQAAWLLPEEVEELTFARLLVQCGMACHPHWATWFLRGSVERWQRYCPQCVREREKAEGVWMDLAWRVRAAVGMWTAPLCVARSM